MQNYGLIVPPLQPTDYVFGSNQSIGSKYGADAFINPKGDWSDFTPSTEDQSAKNGDTFACVSFNTLHAVQMIARLRFENHQNLSDRFLAKVSGTKLGQGNSPQKVADTLRHSWTVNEPEWPDVEMVEDYYAEIPQNLKTVAVARGAEFEFGYQIVPNNPASIKQALFTSPVCIAVTAWQEQDGVYVRIPGMSENHWTTIIAVLPNGNYKVFDSFFPFIKEVSPDACKSIAMSYYLNRQVASDTGFKKFLRIILDWFTNSKPESVTEAPKPEPVPTPPPAPNSKLETFCLAIRTHEGWFKGSRSQNNNNPGNCRYSSVGYASIYGKVGQDPQNFARFKDYDTGWLYLKNLVLAKIKANPNQTLYSFFEVYAPSFENDSSHYAEVVAKACGLKPLDPISKIL